MMFHRLVDALLPHVALLCVCNCLLALRRGVAACCSMFLLHVGSIVFRNMLLASRSSLMRQGGFRCMYVDALLFLCFEQKKREELQRAETEKS